MNILITMVKSIRVKLPVVGAIVMVLFLVLSTWYLVRSHGSLANKDSMVVGMDTKDARRLSVHTGNKHLFLVWPRFTLDFPHSHDWYASTCWPGVQSRMAYLHEIVATMAKSQHPDCKSMYKIFDTIYSVTKKDGNAVYPKTFESKVRKWLGNSESLMKEAHHQTITAVYNEYTNDNTNYNGIRDKRPVTKFGENERDYIDRIVNETGQHCDFCDYTLYTAEDSFGRIRGKTSYTAANAFRWDQWHSLIIPRRHHPLLMTLVEFLDLMKTNEKWQMTVYNKDASYRHPMVNWDLFLSGGASQLHPHLQAIMHTDKYYGAIENWRRAADQYTRDFPSHSYFHDFVSVHNALGLATKLGNAVALANITPKKDYEIVVMSEKADADFYTLLFYAVRTYFDELDKFAFSMAIAFPTMNAEEKAGVLPAYARLVSRGPVKATHSDIGSLELLTPLEKAFVGLAILEFRQLRSDGFGTKT